jgi:hypothetical protein
MPKRVAGDPLGQPRFAHRNGKGPLKQRLVHGMAALLGRFSGFASDVPAGTRTASTTDGRHSGICGPARAEARHAQRRTDMVCDGNHNVAPSNNDHCGEVRPRGS